MARRSVNTGGLVAGAFMLLFCIVWMSIASTIPVFPMNIAFMAFGLLFVIIALRNIWRAIAPERGTDADPVKKPSPEEHHQYSGYCPYCGSPVEEGHGFCSVCGKRLRWRGAP